MITAVQILAFLGWMFVAWLTVSVIIGAITYVQTLRIPSNDDAGPLGAALLMAIAWPAFAWQWFLDNLNED